MEKNKKMILFLDQSCHHLRGSSLNKTYIRLSCFIHLKQMAQLPKNIDVSKLKYSEMRSLASGAKTVSIFYGSDKLTMQTPVLSIPYGLGEPYKVKEAVKKGLPIADTDKQYDVTVSFRGLDENPKIKAFHDKLKQIESKIVDDAFQNRLAWFKDDFDGNKSFVSKLFSPIIKIDKDPTTGKAVGKYPPTFKAKLPYDVKTNSFNFDAYDMENNELSFQEIMTKIKGAKTQLIVQLTGIWFAGGKYGCSWKVLSGKFQLHQNTKISFIEDSDTEKVAADDEEEDDDIVDSEVLNNLPTGKPANVVVDDDEDDDEEEELGEEDDEKAVSEEELEQEPEPEPPKPVKKSVPVVSDDPKPVKKPVKKTVGK